jgi:hypothetical protein
MPAGGKKAGGTIWSRRDCWPAGARGFTGTGRCASATLAETMSPSTAGMANRNKEGSELKPKR